MSILLSTPEYDRTGKLTGMTPAEISDEAMEVLTSSSSLSEQARSLFDCLNSLAIETAEEMQYLSRFTKLPYLSQTVLSYILQANFHSGSIDHNLESIKKSFSILCLLSPPDETNDEYMRYINSSRNTEVESILDTPAEKKSHLKKEVFTKGRQDSLDDIITLAANLKVFGKFWFKISEDKYHMWPLVVTMIVEIADTISKPDFKHFFEKHRNTSNYIPHTIVVYMFNIFSLFVSTAKNPSAVRKFKIDGTIEYIKDIEVAMLMMTDLQNQLRLCTVTGSLHTLFAHPPTSFPIFCPNLAKTETLKRKTFDDKDNGPTPPKKEKQGGSVNNTTGKKLFMPKGMKGRYCSDYLDASRNCVHGNNCRWTHVVYPDGFEGDDAKLFEEYVNSTPGISFVKKNSSNGKVS